MNLEGKVNIQQIQSCLKEYDSWGVTHIQDICTGQLHNVPWGISVWFMSAFLLLLCFIALCLAVNCIFDR